eukprot:CAMPEP_0115553988 /NCGR_PEP_ID=MMETSP0271-20121206/97060_1 /TAXON_ID=71861 /ORGANISM="Scrippsiella trochoidea, Strain CCMP3099" /LENGTH=82 /DNA_ID=CAMNT_0002987697 /DNA_START=521 /DNA_END=769 /DNA_ORIENTATION=+
MTCRERSLVQTRTDGMLAPFIRQSAPRPRPAKQKLNLQGMVSFHGEPGVITRCWLDRATRPRCGMRKYINSGDASVRWELLP